MGTQYLIDSNIVIDYLMGKLPPNGKNLMDGVINDVPQVSIITKIEVLGFNSPAPVFQMLSNFFDDSMVLGLTDEIAEQAIILRRSIKIKLPDAIIAASAMVYSLDLLSRNTEDFKNVSGLKVIDPYKI